MEYGSITNLFGIKDIVRPVTKEQIISLKETLSYGVRQSK